MYHLTAMIQSMSENYAHPTQQQPMPPVYNNQPQVNWQRQQQPPPNMQKTQYNRQQQPYRHPTCSKRKTTNNTMIVRNRVDTKDVVSKTTTDTIILMDADSHVGGATNSLCYHHIHHLQCRSKIKRHNNNMLRHHHYRTV